MFRTYAIAAALMAALALPETAADAGNGRRITTAETDYAYPVSFRSENGGRFQPRRVVILTRSGAWGAALPRRAIHVRRGDHIDLSGVPFFGPLFRSRMAPQDAERHGLPLGPVTRQGEILILDARGHATGLTALPLTLTSELPREGTVAFEVGIPSWQSATPQPPGTPVGRAWLVDGRLVLAANGQRPPVQF